MAKVKLKKLIKSPAKLIRDMRDKQLIFTKYTISKSIQIREKIVAPWSDRNKPVFSDRSKRKRNGVRLQVAITGTKAEGSTKNKKVYQLLNEGTKVRYRQMSRNYKRSTTPGSLNTTKKQGTSFPSREALPGIEAREWEKLIREKIEPEVITNLKLGGISAFRNR